MSFTRSLAIVLPLVLALATGCGTLVYGTHEKIPVDSDPPGANVILDGESVGTTPLTVKLTRKENHQIRIEKDGYVPYEVLTVPTNNGGPVYMDLVPALVFPPAILLIEGEYLTGSGYKIVPESVSAHLLDLAQQPAAAPSPTSTSSAPSSGTAALQK